MLLNLPGSARKSSLGSVGKSLDESVNPRRNCGDIPAWDCLGTDLEPMLAWSPVGNLCVFPREIVLPWDPPEVFMILPLIHFKEHTLFPWSPETVGQKLPASGQSLDGVPSFILLSRMSHSIPPTRNSRNVLSVSR